jgi:hypothetical protein
MIPEELVRITKHKKPRHQLYQPGFNDSNSCWLRGDWITLPEEEWHARKDEHARLYACVPKQIGSQHHRDGPTPPDKMTKAQKQAWEFFSGERTIEGRSRHGSVGPYSAPFAGRKPQQKAIAHMKQIGWKAFKRCRLYPDGEVIEQAEKFCLPEDILLDEEEAVNVTAEVVAQNRQRAVDMFESCLDTVRNTMEVLGATKPGAMFESQMAIQFLIDREEEMVQAEWDESCNKPDPYTDLPSAKQEYADKRRKAREVIGDAFDEMLARQRATHNSCARANLDNSEGRLFSFVLPEFDDDGSHAPMGPRDTPWNSRKDD